MECPVHGGKSLLMVCVSCDRKLLCLECVDEHEEGHTFKSTKVVVNKLKEELQATLTNNTSEIAILTQKVKDIDDEKQQLDEAEQNELNEFQKQCQVIHAAVDEIAAIEAKHISEQKKKNQHILKDAREQLLTQLNDRAKFESEIQSVLTTTNGIEIIQKSKSITALKSLTVPTFSLQPLEFCVGQVNKQQLHKMIASSTGSPGEVDEVSDFVGSLHIRPLVASLSASQNAASEFVGSLRHHQVLSQSSVFSCKMQPYLIRRSASDNLTWIQWSGMENSLQLIDRDGNVMQTVEIPCAIFGYRLTQDHRLLVCGFQDKCIYQVQYGSEPTVFFRTPFHPFDVLPLDNGDLIVSQVDAAGYSRTVDSRRMVVKYGPKGDNKGSVEYDKFGDPLFVVPVRVSTNSTNTMIAVINQTSGLSSHLVLLDNSLKLLLRLTNIGNVIPGDQKYKTSRNEKFFVIDVNFDQADNMIVSEGHSKSIFLLNNQCELVHTLWKEEQHQTVFCLQRNGEVWCAFTQKDKRNIIKVLK